MSFRSKVLGIVDIAMRIPPVLIIDEILKIGMGLPTRFYPSPVVSGKVAIDQPTESSVNDGNATEALQKAIENMTENAMQNGVLSSTFGAMMDELSQDTSMSHLLSITSIKFIICMMGFLSAACIFMLWTRHLVMVYMFVISLVLTFFSYWSNVSALAIMEKSPCIFEEVLTLNSTRILESGNLAIAIAPHMVAQWFLGMLFAHIHLGPRYAFLQKSLPLIFTSPIILAMLPLPTKILTNLPIIAGITPLVLAKITLLSSTMEAGKTIYNGYQYAMNFVSNFGLSALIENEWQRLNVPSVLRVFWTIRITHQFTAMVYTESFATLITFNTAQKLLVDGCETLTAVLGMTSVISAICHYIGKAFQWYLLTFDNDEEKSLGTLSAVLFYILALQTGLTSLSPDKRFVRLCRNLCLLVTALLHFLHNIVSPILMSLSAARNPSRKRHIRALTVCAFLIIAPVSLLIVLWSRHSPSTWLLAVTAFSTEVVVKVMVSLAMYVLFLLDARRQTFWEKLDDYLYYVRAFGNSVEFCFGILLFLNGAWILVFESERNALGGAIRAIMMCIHAYFNIWCEARAGWSVFIKRRTAVHKISALPEATPAQLRAINDVCAICYQEMFTAKITRCRHYFHGVCLRKWLYVQDRCPLCHEIMMYTEKGDEANQNRASATPQVQLYPRDDNNARADQSTTSTVQSDNGEPTRTDSQDTAANEEQPEAAQAATNPNYRILPEMGVQD